VRFAIGCGIARNLYPGTPHCLAIARPVTSKTSVTIEAEGTAFFSSRMPSSTLPDEQDPQSPMPATMASQDLRISAMSSSCAGTVADLREEPVRVELRVLDEADALAFERRRPVDVRDRLGRDSRGGIQELNHRLTSSVQELESGPSRHKKGPSASV